MSLDFNQLPDYTSDYNAELYSYLYTIADFNFYANLYPNLN